MITGQRCRITLNGKTVDAKLLIGSDNRRSLLLQFDAALYTSDGGMFPGQMPVLCDEAGQYRELTRDEPVNLEWLP